MKARGSAKSPTADDDLSRKPSTALAVTVGPWRRLTITRDGACLSLALCTCSPAKAAVEIAGVVGWAWGVAPDDSVPVIQAALEADAA